MVQYQNAWQAIWRKIEQSALDCGRNFNEIALLAVSKRFPAETIRAVYHLGQRQFGENYVQEAVEKKQALSDLSDLSLVLIGALQKNKARLAANCFDRIETVDSLALAKKLSAARDPQRGVLEVLIQVNISGETQKSGVAPTEAVALAAQVAQLPQLQFRGFMGIASDTSDTSEQRHQFARLAACRDQARRLGLSCDMLSMGMSGDMDAAIAEGSTQVRIGTAIFGARPD